MMRGELVETGPADQVLVKPKHAYTRRLLAAVPTLPPRRTPLIEVPPSNATPG
jgi:ABC-type dipeptide/oligopeptide/nickel transport system ATPase component